MGVGISVKEWVLSPRQLCDVELILNGGFYPLTGFLGEADYISVLQSMRLDSGKLWPIPITLDVTEKFASSLQPGDIVYLRDQELTPIAELSVSDIWCPDKKAEAQAIYATCDESHSGVFALFNQSGSYYVGGKLSCLSLPKHYSFKHLRYTPDSLKSFFKINHWERIVAFQTRNPMHRAHFELTQRAAKAADAHVLLHPVVGVTSEGDIDSMVRVHCYQHVLPYYPQGLCELALLPLAMRMAGPREALWHALIRKNYGCTHFVIGRDHAGPGKGSNGQSFYSPYAAQELAISYQDEMGIDIVPSEELVYVVDKKHFVPKSSVTFSDSVLSLSGTEFRQLLCTHQQIPPWYSFAEVIDELRLHYPDQFEQGFTVFFTGLSGSGKSTVANALMIVLRELTKRQVTLLDGDRVRTLLSTGLSFSKEDRDMNVSRIGYVASEITKHRGIAVCAPIAPYEQARELVRHMVCQHGGFIEVYLSTPLDVCEGRDPKGLYKRARSGLIPEFTGVDSPYETPVNPDIVIDTSNCSINDAVIKVIEYLIDAGNISENIRSFSSYVALMENV